MTNPTPPDPPLKVEDLVTSLTLPRQPLTVDEVAAYLRCTPGVVYRAIKARDLRVVRVGRLIRITPEAIENYLTPADR